MKCSLLNISVILNISLQANCNKISVYVNEQLKLCYSKHKIEFYGTHTHTHTIMNKNEAKCVNLLKNNGNHNENHIMRHIR